jgi:tetratricopeptide (TPR) repeat protein
LLSSLVVCAAALLLVHASSVPTHARSRLAPQQQRSARDEKALEAIMQARQVVSLEKQGRYAEATAVAERDFAVLEKALGPDHPDVAKYLNDVLGRLYMAQGQYAKAEQLFVRGLAISEKANGPEHASLAYLNNLASLYQDEGDYAKAEPLRERALSLAEKRLAPDDPIVALIANNLAHPL